METVHLSKEEKCVTPLAGPVLSGWLPTALCQVALEKLEMKVETRQQGSRTSPKSLPNTSHVEPHTGTSVLGAKGRVPLRYPSSCTFGNGRGAYPLGLGRRQAFLDK